MMLNGYDIYMVLASMAGIGVKEVTTFYNMNDWTRWAYGAMIGGNMTWNGFLWTVWLFAFIPHRFFQHAMFWSTVVSIFLSFLYVLVYNVLFVVGYFTEGGKLSNLYWVFISDA